MSAETPEITEANPPSSGKKWLKRVIYAVIMGVTLLFVGQNLYQAASDFQSHEVKLRGHWVLTSLLTYCGGLAVLGLPMWLVLRHNDEPVNVWQSTRAYLISHVGKYVPGKAMAIAIRCVLLQPQGLSVGRVTLTSFYETFVSMAGGSVLAGICLALMPSSQQYAEAVAKEAWILWASIVVLVGGFLGATTPVGFRLFTQAATMPFKKAQGYKDERISWNVCLKSVSASLCSWFILGFSYLATVMAVSDKAMTFDLWVTSTAGLALSIVIGFISMIPGQAFVREAVLIQALAPSLGQVPAVLASLLFRLITLLAELGMAAALYLGGRR